MHCGKALKSINSGWRFFILMLTSHMWSLYSRKALSDFVITDGDEDCVVQHSQEPSLKQEVKEFRKDAAYERLSYRMCNMKGRIFPQVEHIFFEWGGGIKMTLISMWELSFCAFSQYYCFVFAFLFCFIPRKTILYCGRPSCFIVWDGRCKFGQFCWEISCFFSHVQNCVIFQNKKTPK